MKSLEIVFRNNHHYYFLEAYKSYIHHVCPLPLDVLFYPTGLGTTATWTFPTHLPITNHYPPSTALVPRLLPDFQYCISLGRSPHTYHHDKKKKKWIKRTYPITHQYCHTLKKGRISTIILYTITHKSQHTCTFKGEMASSPHPPKHSPITHVCMGEMASSPHLPQTFTHHYFNISLPF